MLKSFRKSQTGVAAIEFAIMLPFLLLVLYGTFQVTNFVITVRKIDNVTNDIGYILSREGCIAIDNSPTGTCDDITTYTGGATKLESIFKNVIPFLLYPLKYDPETDRNSQIEVRFVGLPVFDLVCPATDGINRTNARIMWSHTFPQTSNIQVTAANPQLTPCTSGNCPLMCGSPYNSIYNDPPGNVRAPAIYPGQAFLLVNFATEYKAILGSGFPGSVLPGKFEKTSAYAVRSRWIDDGDGIVEGNELVNRLHVCTDCNHYTSRYDGSGDLMTGTDDPGSFMRQICNVAPRGSNSNGCTFF